jgi:hypothetical protein
MTRQCLRVPDAAHSILHAAAQSRDRIKHQTPRSSCAGLTRASIFSSQRLFRSGWIPESTGERARFRDIPAGSGCFGDAGSIGQRRLCPKLNLKERRPPSISTARACGCCAIHVEMVDGFALTLVIPDQAWPPGALRLIDVDEEQWFRLALR